MEATTMDITQRGLFPEPAFSADEALRQVIDQTHMVRRAQANYDDAREAATEARKVLEAATRKLTALVTDCEARRAASQVPLQTDDEGSER